jgi:hypothetical protein
MIFFIRNVQELWILAAGLLIMQSERYSGDAVLNREERQSREVAATWVEGARFERRDELILGCVDRDIHPVLRGTGRLLAMANGYHRRKLQKSNAQ